MRRRTNLSPRRSLACSVTTRNRSLSSSTRSPAWASSPVRSAISSSNALSTVSTFFACQQGAPIADALYRKDLSAAVDVYADWVDACDAVAKEHGGEPGSQGISQSRATAAVGRATARAEEEEEEDNDDDIIDDEDGLGAYRGDGIVADDEEY